MILDILRAIYLRKIALISVCFLLEGAVLLELTVSFIIDFRCLKIVSRLITRKTSLAGRGSQLTGRIWKVLVLLLNKLEPYMSMISESQITIMESLRCMKFCWDIFRCGDKLRISIFYPIKDMLSLNSFTDAWLSLLKNACRTRT